MKSLGDRLAAEGLFDSRYDGMEKPYKSGRGQKGQPVVQLTTDGEFVAEFATMRSASEATGFHESGISKTCRGVQKTSAGYRWLYVSDWDALLEKDLENSLESELDKI